MIFIYYGYYKGVNNSLIIGPSDFGCEINQWEIMHGIFIWTDLKFLQLEIREAKFKSIYINLLLVLEV